MGYRRMILEQSDDYEEFEDIPTRSECFMDGLSDGLNEVKFVFPIVLALLFIFIAWVC